MGQNSDRMRRRHVRGRAPEARAVVATIGSAVAVHAARHATLTACRDTRWPNFGGEHIADPKNLFFQPVPEQQQGAVSGAVRSCAVLAGVLLLVAAGCRPAQAQGESARLWLEGGRAATQPAASGYAPPGHFRTFRRHPADAAAPCVRRARRFVPRPSLQVLPRMVWHDVPHLRRWLQAAGRPMRPRE
jgi:hypothetical protein